MVLFNHEHCTVKYTSIQDIQSEDNRQKSVDQRPLKVPVFVKLPIKIIRNVYISEIEIEPDPK